MSKALYKFLQKAVMEGKPGAQELMNNMGNVARRDIMTAMAHVPGFDDLGKLADNKHVLAEDVWGLGDKAQEMIKKAKFNTRQGDMPGMMQALPPDYDRDLAQEAAGMMHDWKTSPPGGRRTGKRLE